MTTITKAITKSPTERSFTKDDKKNSFLQSVILLLDDELFRHELLFELTHDFVKKNKELSLIVKGTDFDQLIAPLLHAYLEEKVQKAISIRQLLKNTIKRES